MNEEKEWMKKAEEDFETAKYNLKGNKIDAGLFYLQQSAEKSLKAVYIKKSKTLIKTHDLVLLAQKINAPKKIIEYCKEINPAYQYGRYPDVPAVNELNKKAEKFVEYVKEILKWAKENI